ncbi:Cystathionine gamma-synthase [Castilleja foliolosa]|uniref:Cystathionine gamma-synthase n=1 Tax=Castilleja foliolosa TaxID=1961234 RepID=A0ABD3C6T6_9LAMI
MLPSEEVFAAAISVLSFENNDCIVVYDGKGIFSVALIGMIRVFEHDKIRIFDRGLPRWRASGFDIK